MFLYVVGSGRKSVASQRATASRGGLTYTTLHEVATPVTRSSGTTTSSSSGGSSDGRSLTPIVRAIWALWTVERTGAVVDVELGRVVSDAPHPVISKAPRATTIRANRHTDHLFAQRDGSV